MTDAFCLLDVYSVLSSNPAHFGLPADLNSISSSQSEKSGDKKQKKKQAEQMKEVQGKEVRSQPATTPLTDVKDISCNFYEVPTDTKCSEGLECEDKWINITSFHEGKYIKVNMQPTETYFSSLIFMDSFQIDRCFLRFGYVDIMKGNSG